MAREVWKVLTCMSSALPATTMGPSVGSSAAIAAVPRQELAESEIKARIAR